MAGIFYGEPGGSSQPATNILGKVYSENYIKALYDKPGAWKKLRNFSAEVASTGQSILIPNFARLTPVDIDLTTGALTGNTTPIDSRSEMNIDYAKAVPFYITDNVLRQSQIPDIAGKLAMNAADSMNDVLDKTIVKDIIPLIDDTGYAPSNTVGTLGADLDETTVYDAVATLVKNHVDVSNPSDFVWILPASQFTAVHKLKGYTSYRLMPSQNNSEGGSDVRAAIDTLLGFDVHWRYDTEMSITGGRIGGLFYKDAVAVAIQKNIGLMPPARIPQTINWEYTTYALYGMKLIKPSVACLIKTK